MSVNKELSYDYVNVKRDLSDVFETIVKSKPVLTTLIPMDWETATETKHEWLEDIVTPKSWVVTTAYTVADWAILCSSTAWLETWMIVTFEQETWASTTLTAKVWAITTDTSFVITTYWDDTVDEDLVINSIVKFVAAPKNESSVATANDWREQTVAFNYTQIFDRTAQVSKTSQEIEKYWIGSAIDRQISVQIEDLAYEMVASVIFWKRVIRSASNAWTMWGILYFLGKASWNKILAAWAWISSTIINNWLALANENWALNINAIVGHPDQIRKVWAFNDDQIQIAQAEMSRWTYVTQYLWDLGTVTTLISDRNFPKDQVVLTDLAKLRVLPLKNRQFSDENAAANWADFYARRILGEYTMQIKNAATNIIISWLAL